MKATKGYIVPILTPFNSDGSVDEQAMRTNVSYLIDEGINGITMTGSFGEFVLLSSEERGRLFEVAVDEAAGRCAIVAGISHASTEEAVRLGDAARSAGVDGLMVTPPHYLVPGERDTKRHFQDIARSTSLPITMYNNPRRTGVNMGNALLLELSRLENVVTVKQSGESFADLLELIRLTQGRADFFVTNGLETRALPALIMGAQATYGISPLLLGRECISLYDCGMKGDLERGRAVQFKVNRIRATMAACDATPAALLRELINMRGLAGGCSRAPITALSDGDKAALKKLYDEVPLESVV